MDKLIDIKSTPIVSLLDLLVQDKTTKKNIIWATDNYQDYGKGYSDKDPIKKEILFNHPDIIKPRVQKSDQVQTARTITKAEVFTPSWICNSQNNLIDYDWFGRNDVFNHVNNDHTWEITQEEIKFPDDNQKDWKHYIDSRRLEITCGEAPYLVSRYDMSDGRLIVPPKQRIGILDRKLRIVNENTDNYDDWLKWTIRAIESCYGFEYQGDSLLIGRINIVLSFIDYYKERWNKEPDLKLLRKITGKVVWNIWQMDGLKGTVPFGKPFEKNQQMSLFDFVDSGNAEGEEKSEETLCKIRDWRSKQTVVYKSLREK